MSHISSCLGFPRIGASRELKTALESYWSKKISADQLEEVARTLRQTHWKTIKDAGISHIPSNDFSLYDHILDHAVTVGAIPARYQAIPDPHTRYFAAARGLQDKATDIDVAALEMTKWFDTNYHYIVPEIHESQPFQLNAAKIIGEIAEARQIGVAVRPVIIGPLTFLLLSKTRTDASPQFKTLDRLDDLLAIYEELFAALATKNVEWIQLDEPNLVLDLDPATRQLYKKAFSRLAEFKTRPKVLLTTYFGSLRGNLDIATESKFEGLHVDLVRAPEQLEETLSKLKSGVALSLGLIDGRNIWRNDLDLSHTIIRKAEKKLGPERVIVSTASSLLHVPVDLASEHKLDPEISSWCAFAKQKLNEINALANAHGLEQDACSLSHENRDALTRRRLSTLTSNPVVRARVETITDDLRTRTPYAERSEIQKANFKFPSLPTTTIGSFPQTTEVRSARAAFRSGHLSQSDYDLFLKAEIKTCITRQEDLGLDVLVHGEFERNDMVEYFGEQLGGFTFTDHGWVQSYGSRCVKPPVIYGDVIRSKPMTVTWSKYAQSLTSLPVKGMLTGPVTILNWSFVRDDQSRSATCLQLALAIRDEVLDLEAAGISIIQVDEPAVREGLPLRRSDWNTYLAWAVDAFKIATSGVRAETQIHTHMCYSEFGPILESIAALDADVISIETSRSRSDLLGDFGEFTYPNEVGPGVYDIHSSRVPTENEIESLLLRALRVLPADKLWVNPDCGLKTRAWPEVREALTNMIAATNKVRNHLKTNLK